MPSIAEPGVLKQHLADLGVNSRGWRLFLDYGVALFEPLGPAWRDAKGPHGLGANEICWLKVLQACEMDVPPPPELVRSVAQWALPGNRLDALPPLFLRAAWKACVEAQYGDDGIDDFIDTSVIPLARWFFAGDAHRTTSGARLKAGWESLVRLRRESVDVEARKLGPEEWPPIVRRFDSGGFRMLALCSQRALAEEGMEMSHCVGIYADRCRTEPLRIFSIRNLRSGARVATLSVLETKPGVWNFDQIKGPHNAAVDIAVWQEADNLLQVMNAVSRQDAGVRKFLDFIHSLAGSDLPI